MSFGSTWKVSIRVLSFFLKQAFGATTPSGFAGRAERSKHHPLRHLTASNGNNEPFSLCHT
jgi:hypothetical protein